jgi:hypothetical protein
MGHLLLGCFIVQKRETAFYDARHTRYLLKIADSYFKSKLSGEPWRWHAEAAGGKHE